MSTDTATIPETEEKEGAANGVTTGKKAAAKKGNSGAKKGTKAEKPAADLTKRFRAVADRVKILGDHTRVAIVYNLSQGRLNVGEICKIVGQSQPAVSHHLALLRVGRIADTEREGKNNFYSLTPEGDKLAEILDTIEV